MKLKRKLKVNDIVSNLGDLVLVAYSVFLFLCILLACFLLLTLFFILIKKILGEVKK